MFRFFWWKLTFVRINSKSRYGRSLINVERSKGILMLNVLLTAISSKYSDSSREFTGEINKQRHH